MDLQVAAWLDPELEEVQNSDETVFTAAFRLRDFSLSLDVVIPGIIVDTSVFSRVLVGHNLGRIGFANLIRACDRVRNLDLGASSASIKRDANLVGWGTAELELVVLTSKESGWEASQALLTSVEGIPNVVHHGVHSVVKAGISVLEEHRLDGAIPSIVVQVLELQHADVVQLAQVNLLVFEVRATGVSSTNSRIIWHNDEVGRGARRLSIARERGSSEAEDQVVGSCAREVAAVLDIGPSSGRLLEEGPAHIVNVFEGHIVEVVLRDLVRVILIALKDDGALTAH